MSAGGEAGFGRLGTELGDLVVVVGYAAVAGIAILAGVGGPLQVLLAAGLLGFCPGYAVVSALFPRTTRHPSTGDRRPRWRHRSALAIATSLVLLVLGAIALAPTGYDPATLVAVTVALTLVASLTAAVRRVRAPPDERLRLPLGTIVRDARSATDGADAVLNVALAIAVVVGMTTLAIGLAAPDRGEVYSEVALVNGDGESGDGTESYVRGEAATLRLSVENQEGVNQSYTAVVVLERFDDPPEGGETAALPDLVERAELSRTTLSVRDNETTTERLPFTPSLLGEELRLSVYVYVGAAPESASPATADYHLYRWVDVDEGAASISVAAPTPSGG
ncbi:DUF1616 domain-containing protein [Halolamina rubra]|uniref:DUF1616 domain-containing protein n=1 Tax=Halolamina rubra TaxID=1380430 RepID=UPI0006790DC7|nr:DUF1616 domain-containing protein [Halolamina rubra]